MSSPPVIANRLVHDWDFGAVANPAAGNSVATLPDAVSGADLTQATAADQPTLEQQTINGKTFWVGTFDDVDDQMGVTLASNDFHAAVTAVIIATQLTSTPTVRSGLFSTTSAAGQDWHTAGFAISVSPSGASSQWTGVAQTASVFSGTDVTMTFATPVPFDTYEALTCIFDSVGSGSGTWLSGTKVGAPTRTGTGSFNLQFMRIGNRIEASNAYSPVGIARILLYDGVVSDADRATIDSWVQDTYGITVSDYVPSGSPASGTATLTLSGTAQAGATVAGTASLTVSATSSGSAPAAGTGLFSIAGSASVTSPTSGAASITVTGTANSDGSGVAAVTINLAGSGAALLGSYANVVITIGGTGPASGTWNRYDLIVGAPLPRMAVGPPTPRLTVGRPIPRLTVGQPA